MLHGSGCPLYMLLYLQAGDMAGIALFKATLLVSENKAHSHMPKAKGHKRRRKQERDGSSK